MNNKIVVRFCQCWVICSLMTACSFNDTPALRVGGNLWPGYEPLFIAKERGYYDPELIRVTTFSSAVDVMRAYRNGSLDVAALTADEAIAVAVTEPGKHCIFLVADYSVGGDAIIAQREITSMSELRGKRVGVELNALGALMLARALELHGMNSADVILVPLSLDQHESAFNNREVDAVVTFEPRRRHLLDKGGNEVFSSASIRGEIMDVLITRKDRINTDGARIRSFVSGWFRALEAIQTDKSITTTQAARYSVSPQEFASILKTLEFMDASENEALLGGQLVAPLKNLSRVMREHGLIKTEPEIPLLLNAEIVSKL